MAGESSGILAHVDAFFVIHSAVIETRIRYNCGWASVQ